MNLNFNTRHITICINYRENPELLNPRTLARPDYDECITISTAASLKEMIAPGALVMLGMPMNIFYILLLHSTWI